MSAHFNLQDFVVELVLLHDVFEPVMEVMEFLQKLSVGVWKISILIPRLIKWLDKAVINMDESFKAPINEQVLKWEYFPTMAKHHVVRVLTNG